MNDSVSQRLQGIRERLCGLADEVLWIGNSSQLCETERQEYVDIQAGMLGFAEQVFYLSQKEAHARNTAQVVIEDPHKTMIRERKS